MSISRSERSKGVQGVKTRGRGLMMRGKWDYSNSTHKAVGKRERPESWSKGGEEKKAKMQT